MFNTRWGIDCSCLLYKARGAKLSQVTVLASLVVRLRRAGIEPIVVFDGRTPAAKDAVVAKRREARVEAAVAEQAGKEEIRQKEAGGTLTEMERATIEKRIDDLQAKAPRVTNGDRDAVKRFLYAAGVMYVTAIGEADDVLAYLCRTREISAVISTDTDMLARGVTRLVIPETPDASVLTLLDIQEVLAGMRLTYKQFVEACVFMGTDYGGGGVDPWRAVEIARGGQVFDPSGSIQRLLTGEGVTWDDLLHQNQREKWVTAPLPVEEAVIRQLSAENDWPIDWVDVLLRS